MSDYSDAALLKGQFSRKGDELDWKNIDPKSPAEMAAAEFAKNFFAIGQHVDTKTHRVLVLMSSHAGLMRVMSVHPSDNDMLRINGIVGEDTMAAMIVHATQFSATITIEEIEDDEDDDDGLDIGFVIFDELEKRQKKHT